MPTKQEVYRSCGVAFDAADVLSKRVDPIEQPHLIDAAPLFPDPYGTALSCPGGRDTPTGDCLVSVADYGNEPTDGGAITKRWSGEEGDSLPFAIDGYLFKRTPKKLTFCVNVATQILVSPDFPHMHCCERNSG